MRRNAPLPVVVYTPESKLKHPLRLLREMGRDFLASRELAWRLMVRDIRAQYRQSMLGVAWAFVPPIVTAAGLTLATNSQVLTVGRTDLPYPAYVMFSMALWQTFIEALNGPLQAVTRAKPMLVKINFPREALVLAQLGQVGVNFAIKLLFIAALFVWFRIPVGWTVVLAPVALVHLILLGTAIGLVLAPVGLLYQDVGRILPFVASIWLFLTPVIFPTPETGLFALLVKLNPVTPLLVTVRELATGSALSAPLGFWLASGLAIGGTALAWGMYRVTMPLVAERMSA